MMRRRGRFFCLVGVLIAVVGCGRAPSMGIDKEVFEAVDALYTAVSLHDAAQVQRCATTLEGSHAAGRLPTAAHEALAGIIEETRRGGWESARLDLRDFMQDQRR